ncbi:MAG: ring-cleaving dioxygenase [Candidatus Palauibacterales bacterium]|nr:ring-cleaving dioxygenase [Candidatus Palauibacterales bacterium]
MRHRLMGLHHVTATVDGAQEDLDFYAGLLGLRLVKKTVNFDNNKVYHFYYGDERGAPGTIMTTFPYRGHGVRDGVKGTGQITVTSFAVAGSSLDFWRKRLSEAGVRYKEESRFGDPLIAFDDPSTLRLELIGDDEDDRVPNAIKGLGSVTLSLADPTETISLLTDVLGFSVVGEEANRLRLEADVAGTGGRIEILHEADREPGINGIGTVHHVALAISTEDEQATLREHLLDLGLQVTPFRDRKYFRSIYFREPGGVLIEAATIGPGFTVDEPIETLGRELRLPEWEEPNRSEIERELPSIVY